MKRSIAAVLVARLHIWQSAVIYGNEGGFVQVQELLAHLADIRVRCHHGSLDMGRQIFVVLLRHPLHPLPKPRLDGAVPPASDNAADPRDTRSGISIIVFPKMVGCRGVYVGGKAFDMRLGQINIWFYICRIRRPEMRGKLGPKT